jgi:hypothetical protein
MQEVVFKVHRSHLCPDCSTPAIYVTNTGIIAKLEHDAGCPTDAANKQLLAAKGIAARTKEPQR